MNKIGCTCHDDYICSNCIKVIDFDYYSKRKNKKCDCGAVKAKTTHVDWCSTNE